jgi:hypothetical protein
MPTRPIARGECRSRIVASFAAISVIAASHAMRSKRPSAPRRSGCSTRWRCSTYDAIAKPLLQM